LPGHTHQRARQPACESWHTFLFSLASISLQALQNHLQRLSVHGKKENIYFFKEYHNYASTVKISRPFFISCRNTLRFLQKYAIFLQAIFEQGRV
jgi:hypothetical protein